MQIPAHTDESERSASHTIIHEMLPFSYDK